MISLIDNNVALTVLCKYDPQCQMILDSCNKVKLYDYDKNKNVWVIKDESEGAFYLVKRKSSPIYKFVILGKYNKPGSYLSTTDIPLSQHIISQIHQTFYMFKNESGVIQAILFPTRADTERFYVKVEKIVGELKMQSSSQAEQMGQPRFIENLEEILSNKTLPPQEVCHNGSDKILSMLESARQRYEVSGGASSMPGGTTSGAGGNSSGEKWSRQIDLRELFKASPGSVSHDASPQQPPLLSMATPLMQPDRHHAHAQHRLSNVQLHVVPFAPTPAVAATTSSSSRTTSKTLSLPLQHAFCKALDPTTQSRTSSVKNGPATLTVTELEKYLVESAPSCHDDTLDHDDEDDSLLLGPNRFEDDEVAEELPCIPASLVTPPTVPLLSRPQLRDALIHMLQNDNDGVFLSQIHAAYVQSVARATSAPGTGHPPASARH